MSSPWAPRCERKGARKDPGGQSHPRWRAPPFWTEHPNVHARPEQGAHLLLLVTVGGRRGGGHLGGGCGAMGAPGWTGYGEAWGTALKPRALHSDPLCLNLACLPFWLCGLG